jgi:hypothetical protein
MSLRLDVGCCKGVQLALSQPGVTWDPGLWIGMGGTVRIPAVLTLSLGLIGSEEGFLLGRSGFSLSALLVVSQLWCAHVCHMPGRVHHMSGSMECMGSST